MRGTGETQVYPESAGCCRTKESELNRIHLHLSEMISVCTQREEDLVMARKMQKEREVDEHLFGDKDAYVTSA